MLGNNMNYRIVTYIFFSLVAGSLFAQTGSPSAGARPAPGTRSAEPAAATPFAAAPAQAPAAIIRPETIKTVYVTVTGAKQGVLGKGKIKVLKYDFQLTRQRNAATAGPGTTSGPAISITTGWDGASAGLLQALENNENLNPVTFEFITVGLDGREQPGFTIKLTNATIVQITQSVDGSGPGALEEVHFTYQKLEFQDNVNRAAAEIMHEGSF
jgi:type VI secretion system Hcp family effector